MPTKTQIGVAVGSTAAVAGGGGGIAYAVNSGESNEVSGPSEERKVERQVNDEPNTRVTLKTLDPKIYGQDTLLGSTRSENISKLVEPFNDKNEDWWIWSYQKKYKVNSEKELHEVFKRVEKGWDSENGVSNSLNKACDQAYKLKALDNYKFNTPLLANISKFCGVGSNSDISEPKANTHTSTSTNNAPYNNGVLTTVANKKLLVKDEASNKLWWEWAFNKLLTSEAKNGTTFSTVDAAYDTKATALNKACDAAYRKTYLEVKANNKQVLKDINKFCSTNRTENTIVLPTKPSLNQPSGNPSSLTTDIVSKTYSKKLVTVIQDSSLSKLVDPLKNYEWWEWALQDRWETNKPNDLDPIFQDLTDAYSDTKGTKTLNQACHEAYSVETSRYGFTNNNHLIENIQRFCSTDKSDESTKPKVTTYKDKEIADSKYTNKLLTAVDNKNVLITTGEENKNWWEWAFKKVFPTVVNTSRTGPFYISGTEFLDKPFNKNSDNKALNQACEAAYQKDYEGFSGLDQNVKQFCTNGATSLTHPKLTEPKGDKAKTIQTTDNSEFKSQKLITAGTNKNKLIDPHEPGNQLWWLWSYTDNFLPVMSKKGDFPAPFNNVEVAYEAKETSTNGTKALNKACAEAYKKEKTDLEKPKDGNKKSLLKIVEEFCATGTDKSLTLPTEQ